MPGRKLQSLRATVERGVDGHPGGRLLKVLFQEVAADDVFGMAAEMAYRFLFAVFPLLLLLVTALGFVSDLLGLDPLFHQLMLQVEPFLPAQVASVIDQYVTALLDTRSTTFLTLGLVGTIWGAAGGVGTLIKGLNRAYDIRQPRPFWRRQLLAISVTLTLPPTALTLLFLAVLGRNIAGWLDRWLGLEQGLVEVLSMARWPVLVLLLFAGMSLLYHLLPNHRRPHRSSLPGSAFATAGWIGLTQAFGIYVANFGNYDSTYGSFGAVIAFLLWLYLVGVVVLLGAEVNAVLDSPHRAS